MKRLFTSREAIGKLAELTGVLAVAVTTYDGIFIDGKSNNGVSCNTVGEMAAAECSSSGSFITELGLGQMKQTIIECDQGKLIMTVCDQFVLAILTEIDARLGLIRIQLQELKQNLITTR